MGLTLISLGSRFYFQIPSVFYFIIDNMASFDIFLCHQATEVDDETGGQGPCTHVSREHRSCHG